MELSLELGASCPVVIMPDADIELASSAVALGGFANAGQVCISVQRVIAHPAVNGDFLDALVPKVKAIQTGDGDAHRLALAECLRLRRRRSKPAAPAVRLLSVASGRSVRPCIRQSPSKAIPPPTDSLLAPRAEPCTCWFHRPTVGDPIRCSAKVERNEPSSDLHRGHPPAIWDAGLTRFRLQSTRPGSPDYRIVA